MMAVSWSAVAPAARNAATIEPADVPASRGNV